MKILNKELAGFIVERTMNAINYNIIITNTLGVIIASGDKDRIGDIHEGAIIALKRKSLFNVSEDQSKKLRGVCIGTNLVIKFQDNVIGIIGITGKPKDVLGYGKLIKMTAEMMIEQEHKLVELASNKRMKQEVMLALIYNKQDSLLLLDNYVKRFKIPYDHPMYILIIEVKSKHTSDNVDLNVLNTIINLLEGIYREPLAAIIDSKSIVVLHKCIQINNKIEDYNKRVKEVNEKICNELGNQLGIDVKVSVGKIYHKLNDMYKSFNIAKETLLFGKKIYPNDNIYIFDLLKRDMLFSQNKNWKINELKDIYHLIALNDKDGVLRETLKVLIEENGNLVNVATKLFIHRNTIGYRLNKIYKITNRNPKNYIDLFWLYSVIINF